MMDCRENIIARKRHRLM